MGLERIKEPRMRAIGNAEPLFRVRIDSTLERTGKPHKWLARYKDGIGKYAVKNVYTNTGSERVLTKTGYYDRPLGVTRHAEFTFTDANTGFMFALHFRGVRT